MKRKKNKFFYPTIFSSFYFSYIGTYIIYIYVYIYNTYIHIIHRDYPQITRVHGYRSSPKISLVSLRRFLYIYITQCTLHSFNHVFLTLCRTSDPINWQFKRRFPGGNVAHSRFVHRCRDLFAGYASCFRYVKNHFWNPVKNEFYFVKNKRTAVFYSVILILLRRRK